MGGPVREHLARPGRGVVVTVTVVTALGLGLLGLALTLEERRGYYVLLAALIAGVGIGSLWWMLRYRPARLTADPDGVVITAPARQRRVAWGEIVRVRRSVAWSRHDEQLDLRDGTLVRLPDGVPPGTMERWRTELGAAPPATSTGQVWSIPNRLSLWYPAALNLPVLANLVVGPLTGYSWWGLVLLVALVATAVVAVTRRPLRQVVADHDGITVPRWRGEHHVPWSDLAAVRGKADRWDDQLVLERSEGTTVDLPTGLTADLIEGWREQLATR